MLLYLHSVQYLELQSHQNVLFGAIFHQFFRRILLKSSAAFD